MPDETKPKTDVTPVPDDTLDRGVAAADAAIEAEDEAAAPKADIDRAATAGREGGTR